MNPCPCGFLGGQAHACACTPPAIEKYWRKISGPLLDRIDLQVEVPRLEYREVEEEGREEPSAKVRERVEEARQRQAFNRLGLSMRAHDRTLKVSRTIADLEGAEKIAPRHLAEALQYRTLDKYTAAN